MKRKLVVISTLAILGCISACTPEVGSKDWCDDLDEKPKGDWSANEVTDYAKHCLFKSKDEE